MASWKDLERRVCRALGGERNGPNPGSDCTGTDYAVEIKRCTRYSLQRKWLEQARQQSKDEGKPWLLVIGVHGDRNPIVVMDFKTFANHREGLA